jgi:hypothetical protein
MNGIVKHDLFETLDSDTCYWIGLIATDGCIHKGKLTFNLQEKDKEILEKFVKWSNYPLNIHTINDKRFNKILYQVAFSNQDCVKTLNDYGITERKSGTLNLKIPMNRDIMRGIIDGDGCFSNSQSTGIRCNIVTVSEAFSKQIYDFYIDNNLNPTITKPKIRQLGHLQQYVIAIQKRKDILLLKDLLYKDANLFLNRKLEKLNELIKTNFKIK